MWETQAIRFLQCILMKRHGPIQRGDRCFARRLFINFGFIESFPWTADVTQKTPQKLLNVLFFGPYLCFPSSQLTTNRFAWNGSKSQPSTSARQHHWTEQLPLLPPSKQKRRPMSFFFQSWIGFRQQVQDFYLAVINIPLGFCLKLPSTEKSYRKSLTSEWSADIFSPLTQLPRPNPKKSELRNQFLIYTYSTWQLDEQLRLKKPKVVYFLLSFAFLLEKQAAHTHASTPGYSKSSQLSDETQVAEEAVTWHQTSRTIALDGQQMHQITSFAMETKQRLCRAVFYLMDITYCLCTRPKD